MAGLFGLFDYTKEGPGVTKDALKKKPIALFFELYFQNFWRFILINFTYILLSLPIFTQGIASAGIVHVTRNIARQKHSFGLSDYFDTIRANIKQALAIGIINTFVDAVVIFGGWTYAQTFLQTQSVFSIVGFGIAILCFEVFSVMKYYIYTLMITFTFSLKSLYSNSFKFVFVNFWRNLLCSIVLLVVYGFYALVLIALPYTIIHFVVILFIILTLPAFRFLLIQFCTFESIKKYVIDPYYANNPDADIQKRRDLGLDVPDEYVEEEN